MISRQILELILRWKYDQTHPLVYLTDNIKQKVKMKLKCVLRGGVSFVSYSN